MQKPSIAEIDMELAEKLRVLRELHDSSHRHRKVPPAFVPPTAQILFSLLAPTFGMSAESLLAFALEHRVVRRNANRTYEYIPPSLRSERKVKAAAALQKEWSASVDLVSDFFVPPDYFAEQIQPKHQEFQKLLLALGDTLFNQQALIQLQIPEFLEARAINTDVLRAIGVIDWSGIHQSYQFTHKFVAWCGSDQKEAARLQAQLISESMGGDIVKVRAPQTGRLDASRYTVYRPQKETAAQKKSKRPKV